MKQVDHWIDGTLVASSGGYQEVRDPRGCGLGAEVAQGTRADVDAAAQAAERARDGWRWYQAADRARLLYSLGAALRARVDAFTEWEIADTGKTVATARKEIVGSAAYFEFYAGLVNLPVGSVLDVEPNQHVYTRREPFGVVGIITPWNMPLNQAARAVAPALAAGNTVVVKPSEMTSRTTLALAQLATECGVPSGVFNVVCGSGSDVGTAIVEHSLVRKVTFTGSVAVGQSVGKIAADRIIPLTLELGGKSANVVFADADLDAAATAAVRAFVGNAGQVCSAGTRLLVDQRVKDDLLIRIRRQVTELRTGQDYGPIITAGQFDSVRDTIRAAEHERAPIITGDLGELADVDGNWVAPRVFETTNDDALAREEIFGPVLSVITFDDEAEALAMANDSDYGLVGAVWTCDISRGLRFAERLEAGQVGVNTWVTGAVETPFGGVKMSGYGREKGIESLNQYGQIKCVIVQL